MRNFLSVILLLIVGLFFNKPVSGQEAGNPGFPVFQVIWSNDIFHQTDRDFTNGIEFELYHPLFIKSPLRHLMLPHKKNDYTWQGITLMQHFFTPRELFIADVITYDRPYASYLLIGHKKISLNPNRWVKRTSEIQVGILGKYSGGQALQNGIHNVLPASRHADGWNNQLNSDLAINYTLRIEKGLLNKKSLNIVPYGEAKIGVPYTFTGGGLRAMAGRMNDYFNDIGVSNSYGWQIYAFADFGGRYVFYNGTLEGGLINSSVHTLHQIEPWVYIIKSGFVFSVKNFSLEYGSVLISREYNDGGEHKWGYISMKFAL